MTFYYLCSGEYIEFETNRKRPNLQMLMLINNNIPSIDLMHFTKDFGRMMAKSLTFCSPNLYLSQSQIEIRLKCLKILSCLQKYWLINEN